MPAAVPLGGPPTRSRLAEPTWRTGFLLLCALVFGLYLLDPPNVPDLAAQTARAQAARDGAVLWWTGWFGGLTLPTYSVASPLVMAYLGVGLSAALAGVIACAGAPALFAGTRRPRAGAAVFSVGVFLNVLGGRVTFALGVAAAVVAAGLLRRRRGWWAGAAAVSACLFSPLAALWLGLVAVTVALADASRRRAALGVCGALLVAGVALAGFFAEPGTMQFPLWHVALGLIGVGGVAIACPSPLVRTGALVFGVATVVFAIVPSAVGTNMTRLVWMTAAPALIAMGAPWLRRVGLTTLALAGLLWPATDLGIQLARAASPQASPVYYASLVEQLHERSVAAGPAALGQRVEIVDPTSHWSAAYVAPTVPIARGWDRQADRAANPLFYDGTLTASTYQVWLSDLAVRWVALPTEASLDYAAQAEADLIRSGLPYLRPIWQDESWELFAVVNDQPLVRGARLLDHDAAQLTFHAPKAGTVQMQIRWSPMLALTAPGGPAAGCVHARGQWTAVEVEEPGTYTLVSRLPLARGSAQSACD